MALKTIIKLLLGLLGAVLVGQGVRVAVWWLPDFAQPINYVIAPSLIFSFLVLTIHHLEHKWKRPTFQLIEILRTVRSGELPMEKLLSIDGGAKPLAQMAHDMLHELREEHRKQAELQQEIRERIANRTEALERMVGSLRQQATRDALTGLYNRRMLDQHLPQLIETCKQGGDDLCVLTIDVDSFKLLNDTLGHGEGDNLLRSIGQLIRSTVRQNDAAFRCGGDEFLIVLPDTESEAAQALADRLISLVDALTQTLKVNPKPRLSIGLARLSEVEAPTPEALLAEADRSLYAQKSRRKRHQRGAIGNPTIASAP